MDLLQIPRVIDISAVRTDVTLEEIHKVADIAAAHHFLAAFAMPCFTGLLVELLTPHSDVIVGGVSGFPSGADLTASKVQGALDMIATGCTEVDMVTNVGLLKSGKFEAYQADIRAVVEACGARDVEVKSILEVAYLTEDEIARASELAVGAGVAYVKTGTGWAGQPTTVDTIRLIKSTIGDTAKIKAAGGVRTLDTLLAMMDAGCHRFGIGIRNAMDIVADAYARAGKPLDLETPNMGSHAY